MKIRGFAVGAGALVALAASAGAQVNVALNRPVAAVAGSFSGAELSTVTDGAFLARGTYWQAGTVYWSGLDATLEIALGGVFSLDSAIIQADDNDAYVVLYRNLDTGEFVPLWDVANYDAYGSGMQTRPNPDDNTERFVFPGGSVSTDAIRVAASSGDNSFSVSEVQVFAIPAPSAAAALALSGLIVRRRRR